MVEREWRCLNEQAIEYEMRFAKGEKHAYNLQFPWNKDFHELERA